MNPQTLSQADQADLKESAKELLEKARAAFRRPDFLDRIAEALSCAEALDSKEILASTLLLRVDFYISLEKAEPARTDIDAVHRILKENNLGEKETLYIQMRLHDEEGSYAWTCSDFPTARTEFIETLKYAEHLNDEHYQAITHFNLSNVLEEMGDIQGTIDHLSKAVRVFPIRELNDSKNPVIQGIRKYEFAHLLCGFAETCSWAGDYETAHAYLEESKAVGSSDPRVLMLIHRAEADLLMKEKDYDAALQSANQMQKAADELLALGGEELYKRSILTRSVVLVYAGHFDEAIVELDKGLLLPADNSTLNSIYALLSIAYSKLSALDTSKEGMVEKAQKYLQMAEQMLSAASELTAPDKLRQLSEAKFELGDPVGAYEALRLSNEKRENLYFAKVRNEIGSIRVLMKLEREEHEREIEQMKREHVEKELANTSVHLAMQTELLGNFRNELRQIVRDIHEPINALKKIKEKLKELPCEQIDWVKFEKQFTDIHPEFKIKLLEQYPDLTKQEVKMCQLARLGLKTFEMARLLCLSERSIESHRYTLRKKLGIGSQKNLTQFLSTIK